jgi:hypothetical protein
MTTQAVVNPPATPSALLCPGDEQFWFYNRDLRHARR